MRAAEWLPEPDVPHPMWRARAAHIVGEGGGGGGLACFALGWCGRALLILRPRTGSLWCHRHWTGGEKSRRSHRIWCWPGLNPERETSMGVRIGCLGGGFSHVRTGYPGTLADPDPCACACAPRLCQDLLWGIKLFPSPALPGPPVVRGSYTPMSTRGSCLSSSRKF